MNYTKKQIARMNKSRVSDVELAHEQAIEHAYSLTRIVDVELAHVQALEIERFRAFTNKERNAFKRITETKVDKRKSTFCASTKTKSQAFRIDEALTEFHSMRELIHHETLQDCREARIKSHISFLQHEFRHSCKLVFENENERIKRFKFVLL